MPKVSRKWLSKAKQYKDKAIAIYMEAAEARNRSLGEPIKECPYDFSDEAAYDMYLYESTGKGNLNMDIFGGLVNGYAIGKKWINVETKRAKSDKKN